MPMWMFVYRFVTTAGKVVISRRRRHLRQDNLLLRNRMIPHYLRPSAKHAVVFTVCGGREQLERMPAHAMCHCSPREVCGCSHFHSYLATDSD